MKAWAPVPTCGSWWGSMHLALVAIQGEQAMRQRAMRRLRELDLEESMTLPFEVVVAMTLVVMEVLEEVCHAMVNHSMPMTSMAIPTTRRWEAAEETWLECLLPADVARPAMQQEMTWATTWVTILKRPSLIESERRLPWWFCA
jgi:hypothetical protein